MSKLLDDIFFTFEVICASGTAFRSEKGQPVDRKVCLVEHAEKFLAYGAAGAYDCYVHCLVVRFDY